MRVLFSGMEKYENLGLVGEGSYGMVLKCKHKENGQIVAIKKFLESEDDKTVKKIAMREVRMLKLLRHENLVNLIEVFRRKRRLYLVFEFVDHTVLDDLERHPHGLDANFVRQVLWQVLNGIQFCHVHNVIHRDIKPENILISKNGVVKLCDFGFARTVATQPGEVHTDYVATRWYRAPELLVGDTNYGRAVDIWAVGCLVAEMLTGDPLFPGDSDIDQLYLIIKCFGALTTRLEGIFRKNPLFTGLKLPSAKTIEPLSRRFPRFPSATTDLMECCLRIDAEKRPTCQQLMQHAYFAADGFSERFVLELRQKLNAAGNGHHPAGGHRAHGASGSQPSYGPAKAAGVPMGQLSNHNSGKDQNGQQNTWGAAQKQRKLVGSLQEQPLSTTQSNGSGGPHSSGVGSGGLIPPLISNLPNKVSQAANAKAVKKSPKVAMSLAAPASGGLTDPANNSNNGAGDSFLPGVTGASRKPPAAGPANKMAGPTGVGSDQRDRQPVQKRSPKLTKEQAVTSASTSGSLPAL